MIVVVLTLLVHLLYLHQLLVATGTQNLNESLLVYSQALEEEEEEEDDKKAHIDLCSHMTSHSLTEPCRILCSVMFKDTGDSNSSRYGNNCRQKCLHTHTLTHTHTHASNT